MGFYGVYDNENDDFLDFIQDDKSPENLLRVLKTKNIHPSYIVAIFRLMKTKKNMPISSIKRGIKYLDRYIEEEMWNEEEWRDPLKRKKAVVAERNAMKRHLKTRS